ncbi:MAG: NAD(P)/FAD-dependent oxidoreductase [Microlunatus sp.]|nr:NAD(P)/FAD-dependent oxidoreductase [Microlunatus sp.]
MSSSSTSPPDQDHLDHVDVLVVGAGLSGIGAACHLRRQCPGKTMAIFEARDRMGGTWDLFRYPGLRSDSDMFTLGYSFRPWGSPRAIVDGPSILAYLTDTAREYGLDREIRYRHRVVRAEWSSAAGRWMVTADRGAAGTVTLSCSFLFACSGYYRYDQGYLPEFTGRGDFTGTLVHPQQWPDGLDLTGQRVVVIGSGATAVTLVPELAEQAAHVILLQRSPTYIATVPAIDPTAVKLRRWLPGRLVHLLVRWKYVLASMVTFGLSRRRPEKMKALLRRRAIAQLPAGFDVDTHLTPTYQPWDQRLCAVPDGDLFRTIRSGPAEIVTGIIERFTADGVRLRSGQELAADVIVTATGLNLLAFGGMELVVDDRVVDPADTVAYKGMMMSGVPNFSFTLGYTNASWTLKADLVARYVCRLLRYLDRRGYRSATPVKPDLNPNQLTPLIELQAGYIRRGEHRLPKQGQSTPWRLHQNYLRDLWMLRWGPLTNGLRLDRHRSARENHDQLPVR